MCPCHSRSRAGRVGYADNNKQQQGQHTDQREGCHVTGNWSATERAHTHGRHSHSHTGTHLFAPITVHKDQFFGRGRRLSSRHQDHGALQRGKGYVRARAGMQGRRWHTHRIADAHRTARAVRGHVGVGVHRSAFGLGRIDVAAQDEVVAGELGEHSRLHTPAHSTCVGRPSTW